MNKATLGTLENLGKRNGIDTDTFDKRKGIGAAADIGYNLAGYLAPGVGIVKALRGTKLGAKSNSVGQLAKEGAITAGTMAGAEIGLNEGLNPDDQNWKQNLTQFGIETTAGAVLDPALVKGLPAAGNKLIAGLIRITIVERCCSVLVQHLNRQSTMIIMKGIVRIS